MCSRRSCCDFLNLIVEVEERAQEFADLGVLVVAAKRCSELVRGGVDVHVGTAVAVSGPTRLCASGDDVGEGVCCYSRFLNKSVDFVRGTV